MDNDSVSDIDNTLSGKILTDKLSENPNESEKEKMIKLLQYAAGELDKSPTIREYRSLGLETSGDIIANTFGTWNEAKKEAGLRTCSRGEGRTRHIDESYFKQINDKYKSYWFGTLLAVSSLQPAGEKFYLNVVRTEPKDHFVVGLSNAVDSDYSIKYIQNEDRNDTVQLLISNSTFVQNLISAGYPTPDEEQRDFPDLKKPLRAPFVRGFLESSGYFSRNGWEVMTESSDRASTLQNWLEFFGAKRPTVSQQKNGRYAVRVANVFDIRNVFETVWTDNTSTEPCFEPYVEKIINHLESEYPYPENVSYLTA